MKRFLLLVTIIMCFSLTACHAVVSMEKVEVSGTVTEMKFEKEVIQYNAALKIPQYRPERYLVTISYESLSQTFDNKELYEAVKEGDIVQITLCNGYDDEQNLVWQGLELSE